MNIKDIVTAGITFLIVMSIGLLILDKTGTMIDDVETFCNENNAELTGATDTLHCELENGSLVHPVKTDDGYVFAEYSDEHDVCHGLTCGFEDFETWVDVVVVISFIGLLFVFMRIPIMTTKDGDTE